jgi:hypothetical protein
MLVTAGYVENVEFRTVPFRQSSGLRKGTLGAGRQIGRVEHAVNG